MVTDDLFKCTVCMESFDENLRPRTLNCGHTFCAACINNTIKDGSTKCPHCKVLIHASDATDFPICYLAETLISKCRETNLGATLTSTPESDTYSCESREQTRKTQEAINDLKEKLRNLTEVTKATKKEAKNYRTFIPKWVAKHEEFMTKITDIVRFHEDIVKELDREDKKVIKFLKEREKYQTEINNAISKLDEVTECSDISRECEKLEEIYDTLVGWNTKCKMQLPCMEIYKTSAEIAKKTEAALKQFNEQIDVAEDWIDVSDSHLSITDKKILLEYILESQSLRAILAPTSQIIKEGLLWAVQERAGRVYSARISSGNDRTYLHYLKENIPPANVIPVQYKALIDSLRKESVEAFMDLAWEGSVQGRIHILLSPQTPLATQFWKLCMGEEGPCYIHTKFLQVLDKAHGLNERVVGGDYQRDDGTGGVPLFTGLNNISDIYKLQLKLGSIVTVDTQNDGPRSAQFMIYTNECNTVQCGIFGQVQDGMDVVKAAVELDDIKKVRIEDCGIVLHM